MLEDSRRLQLAVRILGLIQEEDLPQRTIHEISELDLNPIFALPPEQGCRIVDARIRVMVS
jgi:hypothetical protein